MYKKGLKKEFGGSIRTDAERLPRYTQEKETGVKTIQRAPHCHRGDEQKEEEHTASTRVCAWEDSGRIHRKLIALTFTLGGGLEALGPIFRCHLTFSCLYVIFILTNILT